jgi:hypothetical protein
MIGRMSKQSRLTSDPKSHDPKSHDRKSHDSKSPDRRSIDLTSRARTSTAATLLLMLAAAVTATLPASAAPALLLATSAPQTTAASTGPATPPASVAPASLLAPATPATLPASAAPALLLASSARQTTAATAGPATPPASVAPASLLAPATPATQPASADPATPTARPTYSAAGLYNLANSYARDGKPGMAVLNYERARLLAPNDPDIEANLRFVRTASKLPSEPRNAYDRAIRFVNPTLLAWTGVLGILLAGTALLAGRAYPERRWLRRTALLLSAALIALPVCNGAALWPIVHEAVVIANATPARVSPVPMGDPLFVLAEAETVRMTAEHDDFVLVSTHTGRTGWVARTNIAPVIPRTHH